MESIVMPRLLLKQQGVLRNLASIKVTHDGSIKLDLVREGISESGFSWSNRSCEQGAITRESSEPKTKSITIHTSGRINYHFGGGQIRYVPCLLDLDSSTPIVLYSIPSVSRLDEVTALRQDDHIIEIPEAYLGRMSFKFEMVPAVLPQQEGESGRFGVEGLYALMWGAYFGNIGVERDDIPEEVFTTVRPTIGLSEQSIAEEVAFLRFKRAMYANDVIAAVAEAPNKEDITSAHIEAMIQSGPGLFPPNKDGVWTIITSVPMRVAPNLKVIFEDDRYKAEIVELRAGDTRLSTVRVRFKVFDEKYKKYVKEAVAIQGIMLDAELY